MLFIFNHFTKQMCIAVMQTSQLTAKLQPQQPSFLKTLNLATLMSLVRNPPDRQDIKNTLHNSSTKYSIEMLRSMSLPF